MSRKWTEWELQFLKENYGKIPAKKIAEYLGRSQASIYHKANKIGLKAGSGTKGRPADRLKAILESAGLGGVFYARKDAKKVVGKEHRRQNG